METHSLHIPACVMRNVPLATHTTLGVGGNAEYFARVTNTDDLFEVVSWAQNAGIKITIIGGGSNVLVSDGGVSGLVLQPDFTDVVYEEEGDVVYAHVGAGVMLDAFVAETVQKDLWGIENLSAIPGTVGATPVQNVGAYGVEVSDGITSVQVFDTNKKNIFDIENTFCAFAYRDSLFKHANGAHLIILRVTFRLQKNATPKIAYKDLAQYFGEHVAPTLQEIRDAVVDIRSKKFPNWNEVGTAGSFFKNPIIPKAQYDALLLKYPELPGFSAENDTIKVSLGWILDHVCGRKGYTEGGVGLFEKQALVLVCTKGISSDAVIQFSEKIISEVFEKTGIRIEREVRIIA